MRKRVRELEERLADLEAKRAGERVQLMELLDKVTKRLEWRERKRDQVAGNGQLDIEDDAVILARARGTYGGR